MTITHYHIIASAAFVAVTIIGLRTLLVALNTEEARLAVLTANARIEVVNTSTFTITH